MHEQPNTQDPSTTAEADQDHTSEGAHQFTAGGRLLTADDAVELLITGAHPDSARGTIEFDATLIEGLREGWLVACRMPNGQLGFTRIAEDTTGLTPPA